MISDYDFVRLKLRFFFSSFFWRIIKHHPVSMSVGASSSTIAKVASEDEVGQKWDRCFSDMILKTGLSTLAEYVASYLLYSHYD